MPESDPDDPATTAIVRAGLARADEIVVGGTLITSNNFEPRSLNPNLVLDDASLLAGHLLFDQLVWSDQVHWTSGIFPALADSWEVSDDFTEYVFHLTPDARWHDGQPVTAGDVEWTLNEIISEKGGSIALLEEVAGVEVLDEHTVKIRLRRPNGPFLFNLGLRTGPKILPRHLFEGTDWAQNPYNERPIGSGPFKFVEWVKGSHIDYEANLDYFAGRPALGRITQIFQERPAQIVALDAGEVMWIYNSTPFSEAVRWMADPRYGFETWVSTVTAYIGFNVNRPPFDDPRVRLAFALSMDREDVVRRVYQGLTFPNPGAMPGTTAWWYDPSLQFDYDLERAAQLLDEAGFEPDANGIRMSVTITACTCLSQVEQATVWSESLRQIGVEAKIEALDFPAFAEKTLGQQDYEIETGGGHQGPDPSLYHQFVTTGGPRNEMGYSNPRVDELAELAASTADIEERKGYYLEMQRLIFEDVPRFNVADMVAYQPHLACVRMPFYEEALLGARSNYYQGHLYTWVDQPSC